MMGLDTTRRLLRSVSVGAVSQVLSSGGLVGCDFASTVLNYGAASPVTGTEITFELLFQLDTKASTFGIINKRAAFNSANEWTIYNNSYDNTLTVQFGNAAGTDVAITYMMSNAGISTVAVNHLIVSCNLANATNDKIKFYLNGVSSAPSFVLDNALSAIYNSSNQLELGRVNNGTLYFDGKLFAARLYRTAFSAERAAAHYAKQWGIYRWRRTLVPIAAAGVSAPTLLTASAFNVGTTSATARVSFSR